MTVGELIEKLKEFDPEMPVATFDAEWGTSAASVVDESEMFGHFNGARQSIKCVEIR